MLQWFPDFAMFRIWSWDMIYLLYLANTTLGKIKCTNVRAASEGSVTAGKSEPSSCTWMHLLLKKAGRSFRPHRKKTRKLCLSFHLLSVQTATLFSFSPGRHLLNHRFAAEAVLSQPWHFDWRISGNTLVGEFKFILPFYSKS